MEYRELLLKFIASLTLCEHMGDVFDDIDVVLKRIGVNEEWNDETDLKLILDKIGVKKLYDTRLVYDEENTKN